MSDGWTRRRDVVYGMAGSNSLCMEMDIGNRRTTVTRTGWLRMTKRERETTEMEKTEHGGLEASPAGPLLAKDGGY